VAQNAGYAASISISQELLQLLTRVVYNANQFSHILRFPIPPVAVDLYLSLPTLLLDHAFGNVLAMDLLAWGTVTVTPPGNPSETRKALLTVRAFVPMGAVLRNEPLSDGSPNPQFRLSLADDQATLGSYAFTPYAGGPWSPAAEAFLASTTVRDLLLTALKLQLQTMSDKIPPLSAAMLGGIALDPTATVVSKAVDGALVLGVDAETTVGRTNGFAGFLGNNAIGNDIGVWIHRAAIPLVYTDLQAKVVEKIEEKGATLEAFDISVEDGYFLITGRAAHPQGTLTFSFHAVPRVGVPPYPNVFRLEMQNIQMELDRSWKVVLGQVLGGIFTLGFLAVFIEEKIQRALSGARSGVLGDSSSRASLTQTYTIPGVSRPAITSRLVTFECHYDASYAVTKLSADFWPARLTGPTVLTLEEALASPTRFRVELPADIFADDPDLRIAWVLRRTDTNEILISNDNPAIGNVRLVFDGSFIPFEVIPELVIECRVYRTRGATVWEIFQGRQLLRVYDYVDRSHPYVRWHHDLLVRMVKVEPDGSKTKQGLALMHRRSAIHRTSIPGRCRMLRHYSVTEIHPPAPAGIYPLIYLDSLPFPESEIVQNRDQLCDFCFFGGPDKDVPLIP
jgi:hypothetical protein